MIITYFFSCEDGLALTLQKLLACFGKCDMPVCVLCLSKREDILNFKAEAVSQKVIKLSKKMDTFLGDGAFFLVLQICPYSCLLLQKKNTTEGILLNSCYLLFCLSLSCYCSFLSFLWQSRVMVKMCLSCLGVQRYLTWWHLS